MYILQSNTHLGSIHLLGFVLSFLYQQNVGAAENKTLQMKISLNLVQHLHKYTVCQKC